MGENQLTELKPLNWVDIFEPVKNVQTSRLPLRSQAQYLVCGITQIINYWHTPSMCICLVLQAACFPFTCMLRISDFQNSILVLVALCGHWKYFCDMVNTDTRSNVSSAFLYDKNTVTDWILSIQLNFWVKPMMAHSLIRILLHNM